MKDSNSDLIHTIEHKIPAYYVSADGRAKFYTLCNILFDSAASQAQKLRFGYEDMKRENIYWVLSRLHVKMTSYPRMDQPVKVETWPKGINKLFFLRDYRMYLTDGAPLASATSAWLIIDGKTGRPRKMEGFDNLHYYSVDNLHAIEQVPSKLPGVIRHDDSITYTARYSHIDINNHVNAVKYIEWIQDHYPDKIYESQYVKEFQINYQSEIRYGEEVEIRRMNEGPEPGFQYFEGIRNHDRSTTFRAKIQFGNFL